VSDEINVLVAGMPNVGKSSLLNSLRGAGTSACGLARRIALPVYCSPLLQSVQAAPLNVRHARSHKEAIQQVEAL
jgi:hypothetical protein